MFAPFEVREDALMSITPLCARKNHLKDPPLGNFGKRTELNLCPISAQESSEEWTEEDGTQIGLLHLVGRPVTKTVCSDVRSPRSQKAARAIYRFGRHELR